MSRPAHIEVTVRFWTELPEDDLRADATADALSTAIATVVEELRGVADGSVEVTDWREVADE